MPELNHPWECIAELRGHANWIYGAPITTDGRLASVSGRQILLWDLSTQTIEKTFRGHTDAIIALSISPDTRLLASGGLDKTVRLWNLDTRTCIGEFSKRKDPIYSVAFSPNGTLIASGGDRKYKTAYGQKTTIYLWDINSQELVQTFSGHDLRVNALAFSPNGKILASGSNDRTVRLWNVDAGQELQILEGHSSSIGSVTFTPDGNHLISSGGGGIRIWSTQTGELQKSLAEDIEYIRCVAIDPTGQIIAFEVHDGIEVWDIDCGEKLQYLSFKFPISVHFSPDGQLLSSGDASAFTEDHGLVKVWKVPNLDALNQPKSNNIDNLTDELSTSSPFDAEAVEDARKHIIAAIVQRQGQGEFRKKLLTSYKCRCPITGCDVEAALEAAHIVPYQGINTNHPSNGLPLRADIHTLFDLYLLSIDPRTYKIVISSQLSNTCYGGLAGQVLNLPQDPDARPSQSALSRHHQLFLEQCSP